MVLLRNWNVTPFQKQNTHTHTITNLCSTHDHQHCCNISNAFTIFCHSIQFCSFFFFILFFHFLHTNVWLISPSILFWPNTLLKFNNILLLLFSSFSLSLLLRCNSYCHFRWYKFMLWTTETFHHPKREITGKIQFSRMFR